MRQQVGARAYDAWRREHPREVGEVERRWMVVKHGFTGPAASVAARCDRLFDRSRSGAGHVARL